MLRYAASLLILLAAAPMTGDAQTVTVGEFQQTMLARDLEVIGLTANAATLIRDGQTGKALQLLEQRLSSAVSAAGQRADAGVRLPVSRSASLLSAPARAAQYAQRQKQSVLAAEAAALSLKLVAGASN